MYIIYSFLQQDLCKPGDGIHQISETLISGMNTLQECRDAVRQQHPDANGFTFGDFGNRFCYAEIGMTGWGASTKYQACIFGDKRK